MIPYKKGKSNSGTGKTFFLSEKSSNERTKYRLLLVKLLKKRMAN